MSEDILYHELREIEPSKARQLVRKVLKQTGGNVSKTARILGISRHTVRRAREGPLEDRSRRPHRSPRKTEHALEEFIVKVAQRTGYRYRRLSSHLYRKYGLKISENTIKAILSRNKVKPKRRKTSSGTERSLYDYEALIPFEEFQLDTKHLLDKKSLPGEVYRHMKEHNLPRYEWNMIDVCTRARFTAYSYELSSAFGFMFIVLVVLWLRAHNVRHRIRIRVDNGVEFCAGSQRKLRWWNELFRPLGVELEAIPPRATHLMAIVESSHRADDECFLMVHAERCRNVWEFIGRAQRWQDTWNFYRASYGKGMGGRTPYEKLKQKVQMINAHVLKFPVLLMEELLRKVGLFTKFLLSKKGGKYVYTTCQKRAVHLTV